MELALNHYEVVVDLTFEFCEGFAIQIIHLVKVFDESHKVDRGVLDDGPCYDQVLVKQCKQQLERRVDFKSEFLLLRLKS